MDSEILGHCLNVQQTNHTRSSLQMFSGDVRLPLSHLPGQWAASLHGLCFSSCHGFPRWCTIVSSGCWNKSPPSQGDSIVVYNNKRKTNFWKGYVPLPWPLMLSSQLHLEERETELPGVSFTKTPSLPLFSDWLSQEPDVGNNRTMGHC